MSIAAPLALVTGGCRRVGAVIAGHLARSGYALALHGHSDTIPDNRLLNILNETGCDWHGFLADLSDPDAPPSLVKAVGDHFGRSPNLLINNASLFAYDDANSMSAANIDMHLAINFRSPVMLTKALIDMSDAQHIGQNQPAIIQILDQRIRNPTIDQISYTFSKQALAQSIRTQAIAYGKRARINGIAPGFTLAPDSFNTDHIGRIAASMPLGINSSADDIAQAVHYLANAQSVTGQILYVDGGAHLKSYARDFEFM